MFLSQKMILVFHSWLLGVSNLHFLQQQLDLCMALIHNSKNECLLYPQTSLKLSLKEHGMQCANIYLLPKNLFKICRSAFQAQNNNTI